MLYAIQLCEKCTWVGTNEQTIRKHLPDTDATIFCPHCEEETVTVPLRLTIKDVLKGRIEHR